MNTIKLSGKDNYFQNLSLKLFIFLIEKRNSAATQVKILLPK